MDDKRLSLFAYITAALGFISCVGYFISFYSDGIGFSIPHIIELIDVVLYAVPFVLIAIIASGKTAPIIQVCVFGLVSLYNIYCFVAYDYISDFAYLDIVSIISIVLMAIVVVTSLLAAVMIMCGRNPKMFMMATGSVLALREVSLLVNIFSKMIPFYMDIGAAGYMILIVRQLLFRVVGIAFAIVLIMLANNAAEGGSVPVSSKQSTQDELSFLDFKLQYGMISQAEYDFRKEEILNRK